MERDSQEGIADTYHCKCTDEFFCRFDIAGHDFTDEIGGQANDAEHADELEHAHDEKGGAQGSGTVAWDLHFEVVIERLLVIGAR